MAPAATKPSGQRGIQSLELGLRIFREAHQLGRPVTLNELAVLTGMSPSKAHRYCVSLRRAGLFRQDARGLYGMGTFGFQLAQTEATLEHALALAIDELPRLVRELGETVFISRWGETGPRIIQIGEADKPISIRPNSRTDLPLHNSATGRVFAAFLPATRLEALLAQELETFRRAEQLSVVELSSRRRALFRHIADIRRRGLARTTGERYPGLNSFAAPIFDHGGRVILTLTVFGLAATLASSWESQTAKTLRVAAATLTRKVAGVVHTATD